MLFTVCFSLFSFCVHYELLVRVGHLDLDQVRLAQDMADPIDSTIKTVVSTLKQTVRTGHAASPGLLLCMSQYVRLEIC